MFQITEFKLNIIGIRKRLFTGSVPTENLPTKRHYEAPRQERRQLTQLATYPLLADQTTSVFSLNQKII
jgi:hypothetical protein